MMLKDKVAVIYGAGGALGGALARAFAREGANLFLTGRSLAPVEAVAKPTGSGLHAGAHRQRVSVMTGVPRYALTSVGCRPAAQWVGGAPPTSAW
jgi:NAD(P)-dependent dehydrogenase (short-subunit alcohol dehydrogenase family)